MIQVQQLGKTLSRNGMVLAAALGIAAALVQAVAFPQPGVLAPILTFALATTPALLVHFMQDYLHSTYVRQLDAQLPSALLYAASLPHRTGVEKVLEDLGRPEHGALGEQFRRAYEQVQAGASVPHALRALAQRVPDSPLVERSVNLLIEGYQSGADLSSALRDIADDAMALQALAEQTKSALAMHKYTLLLAGGLLVPFILGLLLSLTQTLQADALGVETGLGPSQNSKEISAAVEAVVPGYLVLFTILAALFVALQEGQTKRAVLYVSGLLPLSLLVFHAAQHLVALG